MDLQVSNDVCPAPEEIVEVLEELLRAFHSLLPGIGHIAVPDYAVLNDAPIAARRLVERLAAIYGFEEVTPASARSQGEA